MADADQRATQGAAMGERREDARRWLAERYERARSACYHEGDPCPDCLADAILNAPGVEVQIAWAPYGPQAGTGLVTVMLPIEAR